MRQKLTCFSGDTIGSILLTEASANSRCFVVVVAAAVADVSISLIVMFVSNYQKVPIPVDGRGLV